MASYRRDIEDHCFYMVDFCHVYHRILKFRYGVDCAPMQR
ncbi:hypothetical protein IMCC12053_2588 [Celeribacter marinus]|uniref:Uncharacterized protein n=1 Tax=Celeribacter marinus TaxID=1397108 RepID=A0A0P0A1C2_9RHOB|nr:hypothetical protein IMCC12053_2588 [Celeribacter marinus]